MLLVNKMRVSKVIAPAPAIKIVNANADTFSSFDVSPYQKVAYITHMWIQLTGSDGFFCILVGSWVWRC